MANEPRAPGPGLVAIILVIGGTGAGLLGRWLPEHRREGRDANERRAMAHLKVLEAAEQDFRAQDRDINGVKDCWTGDISGLYQIARGIGPDLAAADARPRVPLLAEPAPMCGYFFVAMEFDESETPPVEYRQITDLRSGAVHHPSRFGICAYPAEYGVTGNSTFILNEGGTIFKGVSRGNPVLRWPGDAGLRADWSKPQ